MTRQKPAPFTISPSWWNSLKLIARSSPTRQEVKYSHPPPPDDPEAGPFHDLPELVELSETDSEEFPNGEIDDSDYPDLHLPALVELSDTDDDHSASEVEDDGFSSDLEDDEDCGIPSGFPPPDHQELRDPRSGLRPGPAPVPIDYDVLGGPVTPSWLLRDRCHADLVPVARARLQGVVPTRRQARAVDAVDYGVDPDAITPWPRRTTDPPSPPPPAITKSLVQSVVAQDRLCSPDSPYPPALARFVDDLEKWRLQLCDHFSFNHSCYADNTRNACLLYTSPSPRDRQKARMPSSA